MKKRALPLLVAIVFILIPLSRADAPVYETRTESIFLEGTEEIITTTRVESFRGYSLWIDTNYLALVPEVEGLGMDLFRRPDIEDLRYELAIFYGGWLDYSFEEEAEITLQNMRNNHSSADEMDIEGMFSNLNARGFRAKDGDMIYWEYIVERGQGVFHICINYPLEAAEGFGSRVIQMLKSFEVTAAFE